MLKKQEICMQNFAKTHFFKFAPERWLTDRDTWAKVSNSRPAVCCILKKGVFGKILLQISCFFAQKTLKMTILIRVWSAQHPNAV